MTAGDFDFSAEDETFSADSSPKGISHSGVRAKTNFFPWHKPRKQWIRTRQWGESVKQLIDTLNLRSSGRPLTYLSLPGPDLLDVRAVQPVCEASAVPLRFLGLNSISPDEGDVETEQALSLSEVRAMPYIDQGSDVAVDRFEHIAKTQSTAYERIIKNRTSFDVVNIDLCRSFAERAPLENKPNYYEALFRLLRNQAENRVDDWLFFITTRNNDDMVHTDTMRTFVAAINSLLDHDEDFRNYLFQIGIISEDVIVDGKIELEKLDTASFANSFSLGLGRWVVHTLLDHNPCWKVSMLPLYGYHVAVQDRSCDMVSLGFYCTRVREPAVDRLGLAGIPVNANVQGREEIARTCVKTVARRLHEQCDLDVHLQRSPEEYNESLEGSVSLLRAARYHEQSYRDWAEQERLKLLQFMIEFGLAPDEQNIEPV